MGDEEIMQAVDDALRISQGGNEFKLLSALTMSGQNLGDMLKVYATRGLVLKNAIARTEPLKPKDPETQIISKAITQKNLKIAFQRAVLDGDLIGQRKVIFGELYRLAEARIQPLLLMATAAKQMQRGSWD